MIDSEHAAAAAIVDMCTRVPMNAFHGAALSTLADPRRASPAELNRLAERAGAVAVHVELTCSAKSPCGSSRSQCCGDWIRRNGTRRNGDVASARRR